MATGRKRFSEREVRWAVCTDGIFAADMRVPASFASSLAAVFFVAC